MKNYYTFAIVMLAIFALILGGIIGFQKNQALQKKKVLESTLLESINEVSRRPNIQIGDTLQKEFTLSIGESTKIFGIAKDNPYYGEPPAAAGIGIEIEGLQSLESISFFEIWGSVLSVDLGNNMIRISSDYPRPIGTAFTPRGPEISLEDIKEGDRIVASSVYDENVQADYDNMQFIQISPSLEEIKRLRETQGK